MDTGLKKCIFIGVFFILMLFSDLDGNNKSKKFYITQVILFSIAIYFPNVFWSNILFVTLCIVYILFNVLEDIIKSCVFVTRN